MRTKVAVALLGCAVLAFPATAGARSAARPDLIVSSGSVKTKSGKLSGAFVLKNQGSASAGKFTASITVRVSKKKNAAVKRFSVSGLGKGKSLSVKVSASVPGSLPAGSLAMKVCADSSGDVRERSESNNCRSLGKLSVTGVTDPTATKPTDPIPFQKDAIIPPTATGNYYEWVPRDYDSSHATPTALFVWMHGCGGEAMGDLYNVAAYDGGYIAISLGGRDGDCWQVGADDALVLNAVADVKQHFNINPRRVILGGYSSGGDLAYHTIFYNSKLFAGILAENTSPFRDTGSTADQSIAAASYKFHVVHLLHTSDDTYQRAGVLAELQQLKDAGFPVETIERPGTHYDDSPEGGTTGTDRDAQNLLLPHIKDGWLAPAR